VDARGVVDVGDCPDQCAVHFRLRTDVDIAGLTRRVGRVDDPGEVHVVVDIYVGPRRPVQPEARRLLVRDRDAGVVVQRERLSVHVHADGSAPLHLDVRVVECHTVLDGYLDVSVRRVEFDGLVVEVDFLEVVRSVVEFVRRA